MEYVLLSLLLIGAIFFNFFIKQKKYEVKSKAIKKEEIIQDYKEQMLEVLNKYEDNKQMQIQEKIKLLKVINNELSMNIFFDEEESKNILKELSNLG